MEKEERNPRHKTGPSPIERWQLWRLLWVNFVLAQLLVADGTDLSWMGLAVCRVFGQARQGGRERRRGGGEKFLEWTGGHMAGVRCHAKAGATLR